MATKTKKAASKPKGASMVNDEAIPMPVVDLAIIVSAGPEGMFVPAEIAEPLQEAGLVEINLGIKNEAGEVACRATAAGIAKAQGEAMPVEMPKVEAVASSFKIEAGVPIPAPVGRGRSGSKYPFDALEVGQSFFVPNTAEQPDAAASLASTVSGATQRYAADHATETKTVKGKMVPKKVYARKFALRKVDGGARVWRVEVSGQAE